MRFAPALAMAVSLAAASPARAADPDPWVGPDKALHFAACAGLASAGYGLASLVWDDQGLRLGVGASVAVTAGVGKELYDLAGFGTPSWKDLTWDALGTAAGLLVAWGVDMLIRFASRNRGAPAQPAPAAAPAVTSLLLPSPFVFQTGRTW